MKTEFYGPDAAEVFRTAGGTGPIAERIWPDLTVHPADLQVEKTAATAFFPGRCSLPDDLSARAIDTVLIAGTVTNVCCETSARDATTHGFRTIMVADANAARRDDEHNATLHTFYRSFGDVRSTEDVLDMIKASS
ncbi:isochorismatase family protein [Actinomadura gamaensis]|uniref:Isochorismatase family protein n=1 Tax=Actinomadura gamaensis TaxID=1763541 RepID=A0ABV9TZM9_9ACTN